MATLVEGSDTKQVKEALVRVSELVVMLAGNLFPIVSEGQKLLI